MNKFKDSFKFLTSNKRSFISYTIILLITLITASLSIFLNSIPYLESGRVYDKWDGKAIGGLHLKKDYQETDAYKELLKFNELEEIDPLDNYEIFVNEYNSKSNISVFKKPSDTYFFIADSFYNNDFSGACVDYRFVEAIYGQGASCSSIIGKTINVSRDSTNKDFYQLKITNVFIQEEYEGFFKPYRPFYSNSIKFVVFEDNFKEIETLKEKVLLDKGKWNNQHVMFRFNKEISKDDIQKYGYLCKDLLMEEDFDLLASKKYLYSVSIDQLKKKTSTLLTNSEIIMTLTFISIISLKIYFILSKKLELQIRNIFCGGEIQTSKMLIRSTLVEKIIPTISAVLTFSIMVITLVLKDKIYDITFILSIICPLLFSFMYFLIDILIIKVAIK